MEPQMSVAREALVGAVDIGGTKIAIGVVSEHGAVLTRREIPTQASEGFDAALDRIGSQLEQQSRGVELAAIGIGCTGPVNPVTGEIGEVEFLPGWQGRNPVVRLSERFGLCAAMENDADAGALAEAKWGAGRGKDRLICVTVGTGIGGGIFLNGALYRGVDGAHPEIGHHVIEASGPRCFCGASGCWEVLASGPAMARRYASDCASKGGGGLRDAMSICDAARAADASALRAVEIEARYLGIGLANLITLFTPEVIVLSGSVMESADLLLPGIRRVIDQSCGLVPASKVQVILSSLGRDAPLIGAGAIGIRIHEVVAT
jgi:glucokinase